MLDGKKVSVVIAAAGLSSRMKTKVNKQFLNINSKPVLAHTLEAFSNCEEVDEIVLVTQEIELENCKKNIVEKYSIGKIKEIVIGGATREESVYNGLKKVSADTDIIISHDGARPFIKENHIIESIRVALDTGACILGVPVKDTIKVVEAGSVERTPKRDRLWAIQTPQTFKKNIIIEAYENAKRLGLSGTDDSSLVEYMGLDVKIIMGDYNNIKITTLEDMLIANSIVNNQEEIMSKIDFAR